MKKLTYYILICLIVVFFLLALGYYYFLIPTKLTSNWPRLIVGKTFFSQDQITQNYLAYHKKNDQAQSETILSIIVDSLIRQAVIKQLLAKNQLSVNQADIDKLLQNKQGLITEQELNTLASQIYGWSGSDFIKYVIRPLAEKVKLETYFQQISGNNQILSELQAKLTELKSKPESFIELAKSNSDSSRDSSGYMGWVKIGQTDPQVEFWLLNLTTGQISEVIDTDQGFYIIKLLQRVVDGEKISFEYSQIYRQKSSFEQYISKASSKIYQLKIFSDSAWLKLLP